MNKVVEDTVIGNGRPGEIQTTHNTHRDIVILVVTKM